eukprot:TRINITY_DN46609_c0_g1_i2.p2 TRINITY_DN46609_c0_g1~~TRINITY_DN46609_c0_g1_i2.p2  ORF type:complete len:109 (-),score=38.75 TRINITY_DN46609_c0_g1_i2:65-391(-)
MKHCRAVLVVFFFLMIRRPPRSTQGVSSAASDVYKRQVHGENNDVENRTDKGERGQKREKNKRDNRVDMREDSGGKGSERNLEQRKDCLLYTSPSPRDLSTSRMPSSA